MLEGGVHGFVMLGTVGENCSIEMSEKVELLQATVEHVQGKVPILTGVAEYTTDLACRYAAAARDTGVDGLMVLPAMVYKTDTRETVAHFRAVAGATDLPIMIYNNPVSYGVDIKPETFVELADEPNFTTIKESSEDPRRITHLRNLCGDRYQLFAGVDDLVLESLILGIDGWVSGLVNAFPVENRLHMGSGARGPLGRKPGRFTAGIHRCWSWIRCRNWFNTSNWQSRSVVMVRSLRVPHACPLREKSERKCWPSFARVSRQDPIRRITMCIRRRSSGN